MNQERKISQIQLLAEKNSPQELIAALVYQRQFNDFDGQAIIQDLYACRDAWYSFCFFSPIYYDDDADVCCSLFKSLELLLRLKITRNCLPADTLYLLAKSDRQSKSTLEQLGQKWLADSVEIYEQERTGETIFDERIAQLLKTYKAYSRYEDNMMIFVFWWD